MLELLPLPGRSRLRIADRTTDALPGGDAGDLRRFRLRTRQRRTRADNNNHGDGTLNSCAFCGRLVADAEMKTAKSGTSLCSFRIASDVGWGDRKQTHWLSCVIFGDRGAKLRPHLRKGDPVTVVGELSPPRLYEAQGETRVAQDLVVREVALQGSKSDQNSRSGDTARSAAPTQQQAPSAASAGYDDDGDIPF